MMSDQNSPDSQGEFPSANLINNRYAIQKILGEGGSGKTYLASDTHCFNELCVLKEFALEDIEAEDLKEFRSLFQREAQILHQMNHPQIPQLLACFAGGSNLYIVQEYTKGKTYSTLLEERKQQQIVFSESEVVSWLRNLLPVLDYIHGLGIVHRDINPDNILQVENSELPVLVDFGVGKLTNLANSIYSDSRSRYHPFVIKASCISKLGYAPREQISIGNCFPASDLYALGVTALVLLTGQEPTTLIDHSSLEWQWQKYVQVSPTFAQIITRMVADKPLERYQSAAELLEQLTSQVRLSDSKLDPKTDQIWKSSTITDACEIQSEADEDATIIFAPPTSISENKVPETEISSPLDDNTPSKEKRFSPEDTMIVANLEQSPKNDDIPLVADPTMLIDPSNTRPASVTEVLSPDFMRRLQQTLNLYLGEMGSSMVVQEVCAKLEAKSVLPVSARLRQELIFEIGEYIAEPQQAQEFRNRCAEL